MNIIYFGKTLCTFMDVYKSKWMDDVMSKNLEVLKEIIKSNKYKKKLNTMKKNQ